MTKVRVHVRIDLSGNDLALTQSVTNTNLLRVNSTQRHRPSQSICSSLRARSSAAGRCDRRKTRYRDALGTNFAFTKIAVAAISVNVERFKQVTNYRTMDESAPIRVKRPHPTPHPNPSN
jgi:hypothetical protein